MSLDENLPTVLFIGDTAEVRRIYSDLLRRQGFSVLTAQDIVEGLDVYQREHPSVLMMDVRIGLHALPALMAIDPNVKCCFVSSGGHDLPDGEGIAVVTRPLCLPDVAQALWGLMTQPDVIVDDPSISET